MAATETLSSEQPNTAADGNKREMKAAGNKRGRLMALEKAPEGEVLEAEEGEEEDDVGGFDDDGPDADIGDLGHAHEEGSSKEYVGTDGLEIVGNGVLLLTHEIGEKHTGGITAESCPCTGDVAVAGHEEDVDGQQYQTSDD